MTSGERVVSGLRLVADARELSFVNLVFYGPVDHRDLHSFPTRRSSDLLRRELPPGIHFLAFPGERGKPQINSSQERSEEHTSELQSRFDLVCRLLLEKKKRQRL